jgi:hypothetical protein
MREICMSGSMSEVWKQSHGRTGEAPPNERGGNRYVRPTAAAPHLDSTIETKRTAYITCACCGQPQESTVSPVPHREGLFQL